MVFARDRYGAVEKIIGLAINVTDLKTAQESLDKGNRRLRSILSSISDCYFTLDARFRITDANESTLHWLGLKAENVIGISCFEGFPHFPIQMAAMKRTFAEKAPLRVEVPSSVRPGRWLDFHVYPSNDGFNVFFHDITDRKRAELALASTKGLLDSTLNAMSAQVAILDETGKILLVNAAWQRTRAGCTTAWCGFSMEPGKASACHSDRREAVPTPGTRSALRHS
jgi:PAS domain S-box-containing protein